MAWGRIKQSISGSVMSSIPTASDCPVENSPRRQRNRQRKDGFYTYSLDSPDLETV
jgi:hypothetical protein